MGWNERERREEKRDIDAFSGRVDDEGPLMSRYVCSSCSSFRGWYAVRRLGGRKVFLPGEHEGWRRSRWRGWRALIYRGNRSLFLSRRPSRPPHLDRYRLVIAFRYLNISAQWNLSDEIGGIYREAGGILCQWCLTLLRLTYIHTLLHMYRDVIHRYIATDGIFQEKEREREFRCQYNYFHICIWYT